MVLENKLGKSESAELFKEEEEEERISSYSYKGYFIYKTENMYLKTRLTPRF